MINKIINKWNNKMYKKYNKKIKKIMPINNKIPQTLFGNLFSKVKQIKKLKIKQKN